MVVKVVTNLANIVRPHGRLKRTSPLYALLADKGAVHGVVQGYEKPLWFKTATVRAETSTWERSEAHAAVAEECAAVRDAAGVVDISGASRFEISGADASAFLDKLSCNKLPAKDGRMALTLFHAPNGGIMAEQSITRIHEQLYYLVGPIASEHRDLHWMQRHSDGFEVQISNLTDRKICFDSGAAVNRD